MSTPRERVERHLEQLGDYESGPDAPIRATAAALARVDGARSIVFVEGISDQIAIESLAERRGRNLDAEGVVIVPIGGAQAIGQFVDRFSVGEARLLGLCDRAESGFFARAFDGLGSDRAAYAVCDPDLEAELIESLDEDTLLAVLESENDLRSFRTMQKQAEWRDRPFADQMHRWVRSHSRRSLRYARLFVFAADDDRLPRPLSNLLERV